MVPPGWNEKDPVPLWVRVDARSGSPEVPIDVEIDAFTAAVAAGPVSVRVSQRLEASVDMDGTNAFQIATRRALDTHGLHSPARTPIGSWPLDRAPGAATRSCRRSSIAPGFPGSRQRPRPVLEMAGWV